MIDLEMIRAGLKNGEFFLEYQPIVSLADQHCVGGEALIRWMHSSGLVMPGRFIPVIENTPVAGLLTYWVIDKVAAELGGWLREQDAVYLGINVPPEILGRGGLEYAATRSGLIEVADRVVLEITERGVPDKIGIDALNALRAHKTKIRIALDDVHLDGANLVVLARAHVDVIKIDASIVAPSWEDTDSHRSRLESLVALMRAADSSIVVEGIESADQAEVFRELGVPFAQGLYFSQALRAGPFEEFFRTHR
jgi:sensor c-di-GMP phosphodiesterase-like protein